MKKFGKYMITAGLILATAAMPLTSYGFGWKSTEKTAAAEKVYEFKSGDSGLREKL